jgi:amidophosphoribosyltransferase
MIEKIIQDTSDHPVHNCGIAGIISNHEINIPEKLFYPLFALQHRGQESCGISYFRHGRLITYKHLGIVSNVLSHYLREDHPSFMGIGHVRYSTHGGNKLENAQPVLASCNKGEIAIAHNGNISNSEDLKQELLEEGSILQSTSDTEMLLHLIARSKKKDIVDALVESLLRCQGSYCLVLLHNDTLIAVRDPYGFRPLVMGRENGTTAFASETCALDANRIPFVREVEPGEIILSNKFKTTSFRFKENPKKSQCIFELIYFSRPDSILFGYSVYNIRKKMGAFLAETEKEKFDLVCPVPDSGNSAAIGFSEVSGIPFELGLTRNHYSGRTFIQPAPEQREFEVRMKLHPIVESIKGKRILLIDDSLVRGTTSKIIVNLLKEAGAKEVHLRLCSPELKHPCYFGIDIPTKEELISNRLTPSQIAEQIGADSVRFLPIESLQKCVNNKEDFCYACFNGEYPFPIQDPEKRRKN